MASPVAFAFDRGEASLPPRAKALFVRAELAEQSGDLREAMRLYDAGVRSATDALSTSSRSGVQTGGSAAVGRYLRKALQLKKRLDPLRSPEASRQ